MALRSSKIEINKASKGEREFKMPESENNAKLRNEVITSIEVSKRSKVPVLFFSNPGYGKTTSIESYARVQGMHVESLIGSQYSEDEILGFQSRTDKSYLEVLEPEWYHRTMAYDEPHYERISSGNKFELVEETTVKKWQSGLEESTANIKSLEDKLAELEKDTTTDSSILETNKKMTSLEIERNKAKQTKFKANLDDIELRPRRQTILFLDELSTASPRVQGAILHLCFAREIRDNKKLPEDCIVLSAANYKANLPGFSDIIAPQLNRFCIMNLLPGDKNSDKYKSSYENLGMELVDEFLQDFKEVDLPVPQFRTDYEMDDATKAAFLKDCRDGFKNIIRKYTGMDTSKCNLDFRNISFDGIYDRSDDVPEVYNFMSPRSMSYYARVVRALCEMGVTPKDHYLYYKFVDGLIGLGTNNWNDEDLDAFKAQLTDFHNSIYDMTNNLISKYQKNIKKVVTGTARKINSENKFSDEHTITGKVKSLINRKDHGEFDPNDQLATDTLMQIASEFDMKEPSVFRTKMEDFSGHINELIQFRSDFESIKQFYTLLNTCSDMDGIDQWLTALKRDIIDAYDFYYNALSRMGIPSANDESN